MQFDFDSIVTRALQTQAPGTAYFHKIANFTAVNDREEEFGTSVDISGDGTVVAISAIEEISTPADLFHYLVQVWKEGANGSWALKDLMMLNGERMQELTLVSVRTVRD